MFSVQENHTKLVKDQSSSSTNRSRRSKSDSEIVFDSLDRKKLQTRITNCCYGTLKVTKNQSSNQLCRKNIELRKNYDGCWRKSTLKSYRSNTLPRRCSSLFTNVNDEVINYCKENRSNSLPADNRNISKQQAVCEFELNFHVPESFSNEVAATNQRVQDTNSTTANCEVDNDHLFAFNVVLAQQQEQQQDTLDMNRPRQYGRRLNSSINTSTISNNNNDSSITNNSSARLSDEFHECSQFAHNCEETIENSETHDSMLAADNDGNTNSLSTTTIEANINRSDNNSSPSFLHSSPRLESIIRELGPRLCQTDRNNSSNDDDGWPISISRPITCLFCCFGLFNFLRFAISTIIYGGNFLIQFVILSFFFGIPFLILQMVLGQRIRKGIVPLFKISPICKGIGISLIISHCILCLYTAVSIGWMMIYLRNFLTPSHSTRINLLNGYNYSNIINYDTPNKTIRFQFALFCCLIWSCTFVALAKGKKSLSIVTMVITIFCLCGLTLMNLRFLIATNFKPISELFANTNFREFFANSNCWYSAAQETYLTWGLLGVSILTIYKKKSDGNNNSNSDTGISYKKDIVIIVVLTLFGLFLSAVLGSICLLIIKSQGFTSTTLGNTQTRNNHTKYISSIDEEWINRYSSVLGEVSVRRDVVYKKMMRLVIEFMPWTLAVLSESEPVWGLLFFVCCIFLGLAQNAVMWRPISRLVGNSSSAVLLSCGSALLLMFPFTTEEGKNIVQYLDFIFGGAWWMTLLWSLFFVSIFIVRGSPYTADMVVKHLKLNAIMSGLMAFSWSFLMPIGLIILTVLNYKRSNSRILFRKNFAEDIATYWPQWSLRIGGFLQIAMLSIVPLTAIFQIYQHLSKGPRDIFERVELLFRPPVDEPEESYLTHLPLRRLCTRRRENAFRESTSNNSQWIQTAEEPVVVATTDLPPNYSPPPSYSKAIGARIASTLRSSFRRSMRSIKKMRKSAEIRASQQESPYVNFENSASVSSIQTTVLDNGENN